MSRPISSKACMSDSTDAVREDIDCTEACMQQAYNYLHATRNYFGFKPSWVKTLDSSWK
jgi:hypothetical protein